MAAEFPKAELITALSRAELFLTGGLALGGWSFFALYLYGLIPQETGVGLVVAVVVAIAAIATALFLTRCVKLANDHRRRTRPYCPFGKAWHKLSKEHQLFLTKKYRAVGHDRSFELSEITPLVQELIDWQYITHYGTDRGYRSGGSVEKCALTAEARDELARLAKESKLPKVTR